MANGLLFIDGQWKEGTGEPIQSFSPTTGEDIWYGFSASEQDIDDAVKAAQRALPDWSVLTFDERVTYCVKYADILSKNKETLAKLICEDTGKPHWEALTEVGAMINKINISINAFTDRNAERHEKTLVGESYTRYKPHGVVAVFGPYNFPGHLPNGHIVPSLLAGNTVLFKPSELTPLVGQELIQLWEEAQIPHGVINLIQGARRTGIALSQHQGLNGLFFTGSSATGKIIHKFFGGHPDKILALEMGGNNPLVIDVIENVVAAAYTTVLSAFMTSGQRCTCARRLIVIKDRAPENFIDVLLSMTKGLTFGPYTDLPEPFAGPLISKAAGQNIYDWYNKLIKLGGETLIEMKVNSKNSALLSPGIIDMTKATEQPDVEIFGPLLQVYFVNNLKEAIQLGNKTKFGLAASILTESEDVYHQFYKEINAGIVNWNKPTNGASSNAPFGGIGQSGNHRPSAYFATDYCSYPVASMEQSTLRMPENLVPGIKL